MEQNLSVLSDVLEFLLWSSPRGVLALFLSRLCRHQSSSSHWLRLEPVDHHAELGVFENMGLADAWVIRCLQQTVGGYDWIMDWLQS